jgi:segregation and condensation protein A
MFEAKTGEFSGPMEKLLELIEARQIEISRVNLAGVTGDFIAYVEQLGETISPVVLSDFVVVASRLLVLKSKILLPALELTEEEEGDIMDLENRLKLYREFSAKGGSAAGGKTAAQYIAMLWGNNQQLFSRPLLKSLGEKSFFYPSKQVTTVGLCDSMQRLLQIMSGLMLETTTVRGSMVSLQEKIAELTTRLQGSSTISFKGRVSKKDQHEVIVLFLAVLHMLANRIADVEQGDTFGDIIVTHQADVSERGDNQLFAVGELS